MPRGLVHEVQLLVAFGLPYHYIHQRKDAAAGFLPGLRHRRIRHGWYRSYGRLWSLNDPFPDIVSERTSRTAAFKDVVRAEEYLSWVAHDFLDKIWDFNGLTTKQRTYTRKWWEGFHIWLLLRPDVLRDWAGVDVEAGKIQRLVDGSEVWENEPEVIREYQRLYRQACFLVRRDRILRRLVEEDGGFGSRQS